VSGFDGGQVMAIVQDVPAADPPLTGRTVKDVMVTAPTTMRPTATVADARAFFADDHVHMALIATSGRLLGTLVRADLADLGDDALPALSRSRLHGRSVALDEPAEDVRVRLIEHGQRRVAVVDDTGGLAGLLCLKRKLTGFCSDADVAARAAERGSATSEHGCAFLGT
jgi:CBS domain-containing protein